MRGTRRLFGTFASVVLALTFGAGSASADDISYYLTELNGSLPGGTPPYVKVEVNRTTDTNATITFTSKNNGTYLYLMGGTDAAAVNVNGAFTLGTMSGSNIGTGRVAPVGILSDNGSGTVGSFGLFNQQITMSDGWNDSASVITFGITSSTSWTSAGDVLVPNADGNVAAAHIYACAISGTPPTCAASSPGANSNTFKAGVVPIPAAAWLFGSGLIGLIGIARRRVAA